MMLQQHLKCLAWLYLSGFLQWEGCEAQQDMQVPEGPLYRSKGYSLSLSCNISNFRGNPLREFSFSLYSLNNPDREIGIISTKDDSFTYARFTKRVSEGDIHIQRVSGSSVVFHMKSLREEDAGDYECYNPITDDLYSGVYSRKTRVHVIPETLSASSEASSVVKHEGESVHLECDVSSQTYQHTHLSVTWYLQAPKEPPKTIISLDRQLVPRPGSGFLERFRSGLLRLDKTGRSTYRLSLSKLQLSDQGNISCEAGEWIQDPDRSWYQVAQRSVEVSTLQVKRVAMEADSFSVQIDVSKASLQEGDALEATCTVEAQNIQHLYFSLAWLKDTAEVARFGPTGVPSVTAEYGNRERDGGVKVVKRSDKDYVLSIKPVKAEDAGRYQCRVWKEERAAGGSFSQGANQESRVEQVQVTVSESHMTVRMEKTPVNVMEGSVLHVTCRASGTRGRLSVAWQHQEEGGTLVDVVSLSQSGVMESGPQYRQRVEIGDVRVQRATAENFTLEINPVRLLDAGVYRCTVSEWLPESNGNVKVTDRKSQETEVAITSVGSVLSASLRSRHARAQENETVELWCTVRRPDVPLSLTWTFQHAEAASLEDIVSVLHTGDMIWFKEPKYGLTVEVKPGETNYRLKLPRASLCETGTYQCVAEAFVRQVKVSQVPSNHLKVVVQRPGSRLSVAAGPHSPLMKEANSDVSLDCRVLQATSNSSRFSVSWLLHKQGVGNRTVLSADRDSVLSESQQELRFSLIKQEAHSFRLLVRNAEPGDSGRYYCLLEEWLLDPRGLWYSLASQSASVELVVSHQPSPFSVRKTKQDVAVRESEQLNVNCTLGSSSSTSRYSVTWIFADANGSVSEPLLRVRQDGVLEASGISKDLLDRIRLYSPTPDTFSLSIQKVGVAESGNYWCQVDEYQVDQTGKLLQTATDRSGLTSVTVHAVESNLRILKQSLNVTVSSLQARFAVECHILSCSSDRSVFAVTWWWQPLAGGEETLRPIFRVHRNFTLENLDQSRDDQRFVHPHASMYSLVTLTPKPSDAGEYYCQVEEWHLSPRNLWERIAEDVSGILTVNIQPQATERQQSGLSFWAGLMTVLLLVVTLLVVLVVLLSYKMRAAGGSSPTDRNKKKNSLWVETDALNCPAGVEA